jgi:hypothetical protein
MLSTKNIDLEFLKAKIIDKDLADYNCRAGYGNINIIADNVITFTEYNFLNGGDTNCKFDGHYKFYVNTDNFNYVIVKFADYGSFTYIRDIDEKKQIYFLPHQSIKADIESLIADKLLGAYFYDSEHINGKGKNLYYPDTKDILGNYEGSKKSLLCDYKNEKNELGFINDLKKEIIDLLTNPVSYGIFVNQQTEKNKLKIPNPYIPNSWRMQFLALKAGIKHADYMIGCIFNINPLRRHIKDIHIITTKKINLYKCRTIKTKGYTFDLYYFTFTDRDTFTKYVITKDDIIIYVVESSIFQPAIDTFTVLTEVYSNSYDLAEGRTKYASLYDSLYTYHSFDDSKYVYECIKINDDSTYIKKINRNF